MDSIKRRNFIKIAALSSIPLSLPILPAVASAEKPSLNPEKDTERVYFVYDGIFYQPIDFIQKLQDIQQLSPIQKDFYAQGGVMKDLLAKCCEITGKEAAIYMPSGTMANQLAIHVLAGTKPKALVQETSHVYRDEADAAQTVFNKRLIPLGKGLADFTLEELKEVIGYHKSEEAFEADIGVLSIETPVRRATNAFFPFEEMRKITAYCRSHGIRTHLDGARLHMSAAFTNHSIMEYAQLFDTVYLCLYKYLGAQGGAVLCGEKKVIDQMHHLVKVHGGSIFNNWSNAAMALHHLQDIDMIMKKVIEKSEALIVALNKIKGIKISPVVNGTNICHLRFDKSVDVAKVKKWLRDQKGIILGQLNDDGVIAMALNPTLLRMDNEVLISAFREALSP